MKTVNIVHEIIPSDVHGAHKTGELNDITIREIVETLGFHPNFEPSADDKVKNEWGFTINNENFGIWDFKGSEKYDSFSTYGNHAVLLSLFGSNYTASRGLTNYKK